MSRRAARTRLAASFAVAATCLGALGLGVPAQSQEVAAQPGASGIGDAYFPKDGNGGYDVQSYDIHDRFEVRSGQLSGWTVVDAVAEQTLSSFNLDLVLSADAVRLTVDGAPVPSSFRKDGAHELVVTPSTAIPAGASFEVRVDYHGVPKSIGYAGNRPWISSADEAMATNEPQIAPWWFPANDHPRDKATFTIEITVPRGQQAISNGAWLGKETDPSGEWVSWRWQMDQPMAPYLAFFAAGKFAWESGTAKGLPYFNAVSKQLSPANRTKAMRLMRRTPGIVRWLETQFGEYPFDWTGGVTTSIYTGFALENQARPTYPFLGNGGYARSIVVHEIAHQWFGDDVSVDRWRDIWLNEGFATWAEWRYAEGHGGRHAQKTLRSRYSSYFASDSFWKLTIGNPGPKRLFAFPVYERGAMTLQALRHRIGNKDFTRLLRTWVRQNSEGTGRVGEFRRLAEDISGERLGGFFKAWLFTGKKPARTAANGLR